MSSNPGPILLPAISATTAPMKQDCSPNTAWEFPLGYHFSFSFSIPSPYFYDHQSKSYLCLKAQFICSLIYEAFCDHMTKWPLSSEYLWHFMTSCPRYYVIPISFPSLPCKRLDLLILVFPISCLMSFMFICLLNVWVNAWLNEWNSKQNQAEHGLLDLYHIEKVLWEKLEVIKLIWRQFVQLMEDRPQFLPHGHKCNLKI
jgi:hypothetical protein